MYVELVSEPDYLVFVLLLHDDVRLLELLEGMLYPVHFHQLHRIASAFGSDRIVMGEIVKAYIAFKRKASSGIYWKDHPIEMK